MGISSQFIPEFDKNYKIFEKSVEIGIDLATLQKHDMPPLAPSHSSLGRNWGAARRVRAMLDG